MPAARSAVKMNKMNTHDDLLQQARTLHRRAIVIDTHCDTTQRLLDPNWNLAQRHDDGHVDIPRLREGGVDAVFFAIFASPPLEHGAGLAATRHQINVIESTIERHGEFIDCATTAGEVRQAILNGKIAILIGLEGGYLIDDSLDHLREYHQRGATYLTLTHGLHTTWADSSGVHEPLMPLHGGLTPFGNDVIRELNRLGMMVDISHASEGTVRDVLEISVAPIIATHSSCFAVSPHRRNLSDELIRAVAKTGGVVQINFASAFIDPEFPPIDVKALKAFRASREAKKKPFMDHVTPLSILADHFEHALKLVGPDHVGIGSDFDGVFAVPQGMEDCSKLPYLTAELLRRGHKEDDLVKVLGGNVLRVMDACADVARCLASPGRRP